VDAPARACSSRHGEADQNKAEADKPVTPIYHITHVTNLPGILAKGGLWCDRESAVRCSGKIGIAHNHIKERRAKRIVPVKPYGTLADYVPFYFAPRSPMLFAIDRGQVVDYQGGQKEIVHLVSAAETILEDGKKFVFSDGHADMAISSFYTDLKDLSRVDWKIMKETYWNDTPADGDRKRRRQAEFLVHDFFSWSLVERIGVMNDAMAAKVNALLEGADHVPVVSVQRGWYY
jgi:hypothetical protein